jgi:hypothetical protein
VFGVALVDLEASVPFVQEMIDRNHDIIEMDVGYSCYPRVACPYRVRIMLRTNLCTDCTVPYIFLVPRLSYLGFKIMLKSLTVLQPTTK